MKATAIYVRVSSRTQDQRSQMADLRRWAAARDREADVIGWHEDQASGTTMDRAGFERMMAEVRAGAIGTVVVWRLDRLGRTATGLTALFDELVRLRVNLVSLKDGVDLSTPAGRLMANVIASVAAYETEVRQERQRAGIDAARAAGKTWGGSEPGWHYRVTPEHQELIPRLKAEGESVAGIARVTGLSRKTVYRVLAARTAPPPRA